MAAADQRLAIRGERQGGDRTIVARYGAAGSLAADLVEPHLATGSAGQRLPVGREREGGDPLRLGHGPLDGAGRRVPQPPFSPVAPVGLGEAPGVAAPVIRPVGVATRQGLAVGGEGQRTDRVAMPFECPDQSAAREIPQPDHPVLTAARERPAMGCERQRKRRPAVRSQAVPQPAGFGVPDEDEPVASGRRDQTAPGREGDSMQLGIELPRRLMPRRRPDECPRLDVPELERLVHLEAPAGDRRAVGREGQRAHAPAGIGADRSPERAGAGIVDPDPPVEAAGGDQRPVGRDGHRCHRLLRSDLKHEVTSFGGRRGPQQADARDDQAERDRS